MDIYRRVTVDPIELGAIDSASVVDSLVVVPIGVDGGE